MRQPAIPDVGLMRIDSLADRQHQRRGGSIMPTSRSSGEEAGFSNLMAKLNPKKATA